jgi:hypothetical protein
VLLLALHRRRYRCSSAVTRHDSLSGGSSGGSIILDIVTNNDDISRYSIKRYDDRTKNGVFWRSASKVMAFATTATPSSSLHRNEDAIGVVSTMIIDATTTYYDQVLVVAIFGRLNKSIWSIIR